MSLAVGTEPTERVPLTHAVGGVVLVEGTRIPLDTIVEAFNEGQSAEEIVDGLPVADASTEGDGEAQSVYLPL